MCLEDKSAQVLKMYKYIKKLYGEDFLIKQKERLEKEGTCQPASFLFRTTKEDKIWKSEYNKYLKLAFEHKIVNKNLIKRLSSNKFDVFLQAHQELMSAYFFNKILLFEINFFPMGKENSILDFQLCLSNNENILVEVKAPYREQPKQVWLGDDEKVIRQNLKAACQQMPKGELEIIVLAPFLRNPIGSEYSGIYEALYGKDKVIINKVNSSSQLNSNWGFDPNGFFQPSNNTRIGAVATLENSIAPPEWINNLIKSDFNKDVISKTNFNFKTKFQFVFKVFHNPYAINPIDCDFFKPFPQFVSNSKKTKMEWINKDSK